MPIGYLGYVKLLDQFLLTNSTGLNRQVNPLFSEAVWGAGWYNAAKHTNYADSQQHYQGNIDFELQAQTDIWNLVRDWVIEDRACAQSLTLSPNGYVVYDYTLDEDDPRTGVWANSCSFTIDSESLISLSLDCIALKRTETITSTSDFCTGMRTNPANGVPTNPLNPTTRNRNPIPGWNAAATVTWPNAPDFWSDPGELTGMVLRSADITVNNNTQIVRGCTGDTNPVAVIQGTISVDGSMTLWRQGGIPDPYVPDSNFTASEASVIFELGGTPALTFRLPYIVITSDAHDVQGQDSLTHRVFGIAGLGDGTQPPFLMDQAT